MNADLRSTAGTIATFFVALAMCSFSFANLAMARSQAGTALLPKTETLRYTAPLRDRAIDLLLERQGLQLVLRDAGVVVASAPMAAISAVSIGGPDRVDTALTIDYSLGAIPVPVDYHPGALGPQTDNTLTLRGAGSSTQTHTVTGPHSGSIQVDGAPIAYTNLTPINDTVPSANFTLNVGASASTINIVNGPIVGGVQTITINDGGTSQFETLNIGNKTTVTINAASGGSTITVDFSTPSTGLMKLDLNGNGGVDHFNITPSQTVPMSLVGSQTTPPTDSVNIDVTGVTNLVVASTSNTSGLAGIYFFGNRANVDFQDMATILPAPAPPPVCTSPVPMLSTELLVALGLLVATLAFTRTRLRGHS